MELENIQSNLSLLYTKAKQSFKECIFDKENEFLKDEIDTPLDDIILIEEEIKIVFSRINFNQYVFEVNLVLCDGQKAIGKYRYIENEMEEVVDDNLLFY